MSVSVDLPIDPPSAASPARASGAANAANGAADSGPSFADHVAAQNTDAQDRPRTEHRDPLTSQTRAPKKDTETQDNVCGLNAAPPAAPNDPPQQPAPDQPVSASLLAHLAATAAPTSETAPAAQHSAVQAAPPAAPAAAAARAGAQTPSAAKLDADVSPARDAVQQAKQGALGQSANLEQSGDVAAAAPLAAAIVAAATPPQSQSPPSKNAARTENAGALPIAGHGESALPPAAHLAASAPAPPPAPLAQTAQPQPGDADPAPGQTKAEAAADPPPQQSQAPSQPSPAVAPPQTLARAPDAASLLAPAPAPSVSPHELGAQVSHEIVRRFAGGITQFAVRLDPPELGRVDVRLEVGRDQRVSAVIAADNPQALTDLTRSAREIAHALHSAGLELRENGLSFDLSQRQFGHADQNAHNPRPFATSAPETRASPSVSPSVQPLRLERWQGMHVNLVA